MIMRLLMSAVLVFEATAGFASTWDYDNFRDVSELGFGTLVLNVGARSSGENRDLNNKRFKLLPYGETTTVPYQETYCLNLVHYAPYLDARSRPYKIAQVAKLSTGLSLSSLYEGAFTPTDTKNRGRYPDYCFKWPEEATELHFTVVATPFRSDKEIVLRRAPM